MNNKTNSLQVALLNSKVIRWLNVQKPELLNLIAENYASHLGCSMCEVSDFDEPQYLGNEALSWVYGKFTIDIDQFDREVIGKRD